MFLFKLHIPALCIINCRQKSNAHWLIAIIIIIEALGWLSHLVSAFGSGHGPRIPGSSPAPGSLLRRKPASPSATPPTCVPALAISLCQINKEN